MAGNRLLEVPKEVLSLPRLRRLDMVGNGVVCPPSEVCLNGVEAMREFYCISNLRSCLCTQCAWLADGFDVDVDKVRDGDEDSCFESADDELDSLCGDQSELALNR